MDLESLKGKLSASTLAALMEHLNETAKLQETSGVDASAAQVGKKDELEEQDGKLKYEHVNNFNAGVTEDFGLSQFWYTKETSETLAKEALNHGGKPIEGVNRVAFVSCPSAFRAALEFVTDKHDITLFEYDQRFDKAYGDKFCFFDFNHPENIPEKYHHQFDFVMADPPYLTEACASKTIEAMKLLAKDENTLFLFNTGEVMYEFMEKNGLRSCVFHPEHASKLGNPFCTYANYESEALGGYEQF